jgi:hypothetical protein
VQAIRKYGKASFIIVEAATGTDKDDLDAKERRWVALLTSMSPTGYNLTTGGRSAGKPSKETVEKRRAALLGHTISQSTRDKIRKALTGK